MRNIVLRLSVTVFVCAAALVGAPRAIEADQASVRWDLLDGRIGYIAVLRFDAGTAVQVKGAALDLAERSGGRPLGYIIDLRDVAGGSPEAAADVAQQLMPAARVVLRRGEGAAALDYQAPPGIGGDAAGGKPLLALIDAGSGTAAKVVAAALQDWGRATLVGVTTEATDGAACGRVPCHRPSGGRIDGAPVVPDVNAAGAGHDPLALALALLSGKATDRSFPPMAKMPTRTAADTAEAGSPETGTKETSRAPDEKEILQEADRAYYSLRALGLDTFACSIEPNWDLMIADQGETEPAVAVDRALRTMRRLRFTVAVDRNGDAKIDHRGAVGKNMQGLAGAVEANLGDFFNIWTEFVLVPPLPDPTDATGFDAEGGLYHLTYRTGEYDTAMTMTNGFAVTALDITGPAGATSIRPHFAKTPGGWLLDGYEAERSPKGGAMAASEVAVDYGQVDGLQIVRKVRMTHHTSADEKPEPFEFVFSRCSVTKR